MRSYINDVVWRGVAESRQRTLRAVLFRTPFRIRSPVDMVQRAQALSRQVCPRARTGVGRGGEEARVSRDGCHSSGAQLAIASVPLLVASHPSTPPPSTPPPIRPHAHCAADPGLCQR
jgi:hypothetical protein